eukprot:9492545-Pyramimonas_sp.AAC.1
MARSTRPSSPIAATGRSDSDSGGPSSLRRLEGRELEVLLGHCTFVGLMCRETLSVWHTVCTFIRE